MYRSNTQLPRVQPEYEPFITRHHIYGLVFLFVVFGALIFVIYDWQYGKQPAITNPDSRIGGGNGQFCIDVIQTAKNDKTGEIRDFSTPCDVPSGWTKIGPVTYDNTDDWRTYTNDRFNLSFKYPAEFKLVRDNTFSESDHFSHILELRNNSVEEKPLFKLEINRKNEQKYYPDKVYVLMESLNKGFDVVERSLTEYPESKDGKTVIEPEPVASINGNEYEFRFEYQEGGQNYEELFVKILSTFDTIK
jgi:hypothetical protein